MARRGFFLLQRVELEQDGQHVSGIEVIGHLHPFMGAQSEDVHSRFYDNQGNTLDYVYEPDGDTLPPQNPAFEREALQVGHRHGGQGVRGAAPDAVPGVLGGDRRLRPRLGRRARARTGRILNGVTITHIGGPTALIETGGWRLLTDPTFDPPGGDYSFGVAIGSTKLAGPAIPASELGPIDAVLLSHDHHEDNLDRSARGLAPGESTRLEAPGKTTIEVIATPCRHGPPLSRPLVGDVVGFALRWDSQEHGVLWITGDTVLYVGVKRVAERFAVDTVLLHLGGVRFPITDVQPATR